MNDNDLVCSILHCPIVYNVPSVLELLLKKGANPNEKTLINTPMELAEECGYKNIVKILIKYGANPISLEYAAQLRFIELAGELDIPERVDGRFVHFAKMKKALKNGASIDGANRTGKTALCNAISSNNSRAVTFLLKNGANPNTKNKSDSLMFTPLHTWVMHAFYLDNKEENSYKDKEKDSYKAACKAYKEKSYRQIGKDLLKAGTFVSARNTSGATPLHIAAEINYIGAAKILLEAGAKVMPKDNKGWTPLDYAESAEMISLLKSYGAKEQ